MTLKNAPSQACAACKYQRRRCHPDCPLAPYFPADKPKTFQNAHKLFGVSNIMKILKQVKDGQKDEAMQSIIYEADMRQRFPVHGCSLVTFQLSEQLRLCQQELHHVNSWLSTLRSKDHSHLHFQLPSNFSGINNDSNLNLPPFSNEDGYVESTDIKPAFWIQSPNQNYIGNTYNNCSLSMKSHVMQEIEVPRDYYDTIADVRQCYELQEACQSSGESTLNETMKSMDTVSQNHELKIAAACFSLKSVDLGKTFSP